MKKIREGWGYDVPRIQHGGLEMTQGTLFDKGKWWDEYWAGMPEFQQENQASDSSIIVHFRNSQDRRSFLRKLDEDPGRQKSIWYPKMEYLQQSKKSSSTSVTQGSYPIYVISKGRWETGQTVKTLQKLGIAFKLVVEPQEREHYIWQAGEENVLALPFSNLGQGSIPARNWCWEHAKSLNFSYHWIMDDNIDGFYKLNNNLKIKIIDENPFQQMENFVTRFSNVALAGPQYEFFACRRSEYAPFRLNTRIYSCILIKNDLPYGWRGRYNEDTDLSLRALKDSWCTVLFNFFLIKKMPTMKMKGGNTDELYKKDGRRKMAESLKEQHPDIVTITEKWGRFQHQVNYTGFTQELKLK
jgi:hypothetical protein